MTDAEIMAGKKDWSIDHYVLRFENGPMADRHNIDTVAGSSGNTMLKKELFGWPLPDRLGILCHVGVEQVAFWDADDVEAAELPVEITGSPNALVYRKIAESKLPESVDRERHVVRGATYRLERP